MTGRGLQDLMRSSKAGRKHGQAVKRRRRRPIYRATHRTLHPSRLRRLPKHGATQKALQPAPAPEAAPATAPATKPKVGLSLAPLNMPATLEERQGRWWWWRPTTPASWRPASRARSLVRRDYRSAPAPSRMRRPQSAGCALARMQGCTSVLRHSGRRRHRRHLHPRGPSARRLRHRDHDRLLHALRGMSVLPTDMLSSASPISSLCFMLCPIAFTHRLAVYRFINMTPARSSSTRIVLPQPYRVTIPRSLAPLSVSHTRHSKIMTCVVASSRTYSIGSTSATTSAASSRLRGSAASPAQKAASSSSSRASRTCASLATRVASPSSPAAAGS